ncbi:MAG: hypothetical protein ABSF80_06600 [Chitinispirillaceae bacterium]|jgi:hypothetical protein
MKKLLFFSLILIFGVTGINASQQYDELVKLVKSGASEEVIVAYINASDSSYNLSSDEIVHLKEYGASPHVIVAAIQHKGSVLTNSNNIGVPTETTSVIPPGPYEVYRVPSPWRPRRLVNNNWYEKVAKMNQAFQVDIVGLSQGAFRLNYEYLLHRRYGFVVEGNYYYTGWDSRGENIELMYRWHWVKSMNSGFFSVFIKGGRFYGNENDLLRGEPDFWFTQTSVTLGPDIGSRWVSPWGLSVVARIGYGYTWSIFNGAAPDRRTQDWLQLSSGLDYELSLGYAF